MADTEKSGKGNMIFAIVVAGIAGLVAGYVGRDVMATSSTQTPPLSSMLTEPAATAVAPPEAAAIAAAQSEMVRRYELINQGFVGQLRQYGLRLSAMADVAEKEGAPNAAEQMRDFAKETDDIIARYDRVSKQ